VSREKSHNSRLSCHPGLVNLVYALDSHYLFTLTVNVSIMALPFSLYLLVVLVSQVSAFSISHNDRTPRSVETVCRMSAEDSSPSTNNYNNIVDRSTLTLLEHINLKVPSQEYILSFYFELLGCGLDPRKAANLEPGAPKTTIWASCGASQFHLPHGDVGQRIPGHIGLRYDSLEGLKKRVQEFGDQKAIFLKDYEIGADPRSQREFVKLVDMYDNVFYCRAGDPVNTDKEQPMIRPDETNEWGDHATKYGRIESDCRGVDYVEFLVPKGTAERIALFYESVLDVTTTCVEVEAGMKIAIIAFGNVDQNGKAAQSLLFRETTEAIPPYDGHHVAMYVGETAADFEQAYKNTELAGVVWCNQRFSDKADTLQGAKEWKQFRFKDIVDMKTGETIFELEHEMRSVEHEAWPGK
jgi:hypothetical protein